MKSTLRIGLPIAFLAAVIALPQVGWTQSEQKEAAGKTEAAKNDDTKKSDEAIDEEDKPVVEFAEMYNKRFSGRPPKLGETLPDANGYLFDGSPFALNETRGKYMVIVFGCLT